MPTKCPRKGSDIIEDRVAFCASLVNPQVQVNLSRLAPMIPVHLLFVLLRIAEGATLLCFRLTLFTFDLVILCVSTHTSNHTRHSTFHDRCIHIQLYILAHTHNTFVFVCLFCGGVHHSPIGRWFLIFFETQLEFFSRSAVELKPTTPLFPSPGYSAGPLRIRPLRVWKLEHKKYSVFVGIQYVFQFQKCKIGLKQDPSARVLNRFVDCF